VKNSDQNISNSDLRSIRSKPDVQNNRKDFISENPFNDDRSEISIDNENDNEDGKNANGSNVNVRNYFKTFVPSSLSQLELRNNLGACEPAFMNFVPDPHNSQFQLVELGFDSPHKKEIAIQLLDVIQKHHSGSDTKVMNVPLLTNDNSGQKSYVHLEPLIFDRPDFPNAEDGESASRKMSIHIPGFGDDTSDDDSQTDDWGVIYKCGSPKNNGNT